MKPNIEKNPTDDFEIGKKLGEGKFGSVNIVRHKKTQGIFVPFVLVNSIMQKTTAHSSEYDLGLIN